MRKRFGALLLVLGAALLVMPAFAQDELPLKLVNAKMASELMEQSRALRGSQVDPGLNDTTWVGYNPAYAGSNYWSIGTGKRFPPSVTGTNSSIPNINGDASRGFWDWEAAIHGDSLQGWWPQRHQYTFSLANSNDKVRTFYCNDLGNSISYVINQGPGLRRTYGVTGAWHQDPGSGAMTLDPAAPDVNPKSPTWTPIAGTGSAWCGLRGHGDLTRVDPVTGNPYNQDVLQEIQESNANVTTAPGFTNYKFPGYASAWDQMLYRDVDITGASNAANVSVSFKYRTRLSTDKATTATRVAGWFDKDPLAVSVGNFISGSDAGPLTGAPIDSFMVYVGCPVADTVGAPWKGSDGVTHEVFDPVRRWFGELVRANEAGGYIEMHTNYGNDPALPGDNGFNTVTRTRPVTYGTLKSTWGNKVRLVFRIKTNHGKGSNAADQPSDDASGSLIGSYSSGGLGAAEIDDVSIDLGAGPVSLGGFETQGEIDNSGSASALDFWKTSSKPPAIFNHYHDLGTLNYNDLCGPPGSIYRICDMVGGVISAGDHDDGEVFTPTSSPADQECFSGITSPTINLCYDHTAKTAGGCPGGKNNMGLDCDTANPTSEFAIVYNMAALGFDVFSTGGIWQFYAISYPAQQTDGTGTNNLTNGTRCWGVMRVPTFLIFNPDPQCFDDYEALNGLSMVRTTNSNGTPDSIRIGLRKISEVWRFAGLGATYGAADGCYWDIVSLALVDGNPSPISVDIWNLFQDTFPANESVDPTNAAAFDTCAAYVQGGLNASPLTTSPFRYVTPEDSIPVAVAADSVEVQLKFRIWPGPGNYRTFGDPCSGLRRVPFDTTRIQAGDLALTDPYRKFWTAYILDPGKEKTGFPTTGPCKGGGTLRHDQRWNELVWCNARMDTGEVNVFPVEKTGLGIPINTASFVTTYHELDPKFAALGIVKNKCFVVDTTQSAISTNTTCSTVPSWVTTRPGTGYGGSSTTREGTKILPDGIFTPGTHIEYFFVVKNLKTGAFDMVPDTNRVTPQDDEGSIDGHRWQEFSVLPDLWKSSVCGGLGRAAMLYVDWNDRRGDERVWVSVADSIGATRGDRRGGHNGWIGKSKSNLNDPTNFVNKNCGAGTTWDMYGVKASESLTTGAGSIGSRLGYRAAGTFLSGKDARNAPTPAMLNAYYRIMLILTGDLNSGILGPFNDRSADDQEVINQFVLAGTANAHRGLLVGGNGAIESEDFTNLASILSVSLRSPNYLNLSGIITACVDLVPQPVITANGDIYGLRNTCTQTPDVLTPEGDGQAASYYQGGTPFNQDYVASVFTDAEPAGNPDRHYQALVEGWDIFWLRSRLCDKTTGRMAYYFNVFTNIFGKICAVAGTPQQTVEVPNNNDGSAFVDFAGVGNNPLRQGSAVINLTLARADRVTVKIYDVSGRLVRTLADGQMFKAGKVDPALTWDGLDNGGRQVARGAYFVSVRYQNSKFDASRKMIVLK